MAKAAESGEAEQSAGGDAEVRASQPLHYAPRVEQHSEGRRCAPPLMPNPLGTVARCCKSRLRDQERSFILSYRTQVESGTTQIGQSNKEASTLSKKKGVSSRRPLIVSIDGITTDVALIYGASQLDLTLSLSEALRARGISTQWDEGRREATISHILDNVIDPILRVSRCVVAIVTAQSVLSDFFVAELTLSDDYSKPIVAWKPGNVRFDEQSEPNAASLPGYLQLAKQIATNIFGMKPATPEEETKSRERKVKEVSGRLAGQNNIITLTHPSDQIGAVVNYLEWFVSELRQMQQRKMPITGSNARVAIAGKDAPSIDDGPLPPLGPCVIGRANFLGNQGYSLQAQGHLAEAWTLHLEALSLHRRAGSRMGEAIDLGNFGVIELNRGNLESGLSYFLQSLEIHRSIGDLEAEADQLNNAAVVERLQGHLDAALRRHMNALAIYQDLRSARGEASQYANIGNVYHSMGQLDDAVNHHARALTAYRKMEIPEAQAKCLGNIGMIAEERGRMEEALANFREALQLARQSSSRHDEVNTLISIGRALRAQGKLSQASDHLSEALALAQTFGFYDLEGAANILIGEMAESEMGDD